MKTPRPYYATLKVEKVENTQYLFDVSRSVEGQGYVWAARIRIYLDVEIVRGWLNLGEASALRTHLPQIRFDSPQILPL